MNSLMVYLKVYWAGSTCHIFQSPLLKLQHCGSLWHSQLSKPLPSFLLWMQSVSEVRVLKHTCSVSVALLVMYMCYFHTCSSDLCDSNCKLLWLFQCVIGVASWCILQAVFELDKPHFIATDATRGFGDSGMCDRKSSATNSRQSAGRHY